MLLKEEEECDAMPSKVASSPELVVTAGNMENCGAVTFSLGDRSDHRGAGAPTGKHGGE